DLGVPIECRGPLRRHVSGEAQRVHPAVAPWPADHIVEQTAPREAAKQTFAAGIRAANETDSARPLYRRKGVVKERRVGNRQLVGILVARQPSRIVEQDQIEAPGPSSGVVNLVWLVEQPDRRSKFCEAIAPALHEAPAVHDEEQVRAKTFDLLGQLD